MLPDMSTRFGATAYLPTTKGCCRTRRKTETSCWLLCIRIRAGPSAEAPQHPGFVQGDVVGLVALDFILRLIRRSAVNVAFIIDGSFMHFDDFSAHTPGFRIPAHVIANLERHGHGSVLVRSL